jgi:hypothetical protein
LRWPLTATEKNDTFPGAGNGSVIGGPSGFPAGNPGGGAAPAADALTSSRAATTIERVARLIS